MKELFPGNNWQKSCYWYLNLKNLLAHITVTLQLNKKGSIELIKFQKIIFTISRFSKSSSSSHTNTLTLKPRQHNHWFICNTMFLFQPSFSENEVKTITLEEADKKKGPGDNLCAEDWFSNMRKLNNFLGVALTKSNHCF